MYVASAFAFTPAAIIWLADVCLASCSVIGSSPARRQAFFDRSPIVTASKGMPSAREDVTAAAGALLVLDEVVAQHHGDRSRAVAGARLRLDVSLANLPRARP